MDWADIRAREILGAAPEGDFKRVAEALRSEREGCAFLIESQSSIGVSILELARLIREQD